MMKQMEGQVDGERHGKEKMGEGRTATKQRRLFHGRTGKEVLRLEEISHFTFSSAFNPAFLFVLLPTSKAPTNQEGTTQKRRKGKKEEKENKKCEEVLLHSW